jgi:membrane protein
MRFPGNGMTWKEFVQGLKDEISRDNVTDLAATVTFYGVLALFPFVLFLVALGTLVIKPEQAEALVQQLSAMAPGPVTQLVGERIQQLTQQQNVTLLGFGALGAIWAASGAILALTRALDIIYDVKDERPFWKVRGIAILMTIVVGVLALVAALCAVAAEPIARAVGEPMGTVIIWLRLPVAGLVMMFLWALLYYVLPDVEQEFKFITPGSVIGVILWVIASWGFGKYVSNFGNYDKTYGSIAGVIVLLLWMWISALVLLAGAEINAFIEHRSPEGKRQGAKAMAERGTEPKAVATVGEPVPVEGAGRPAPGGARGRGPIRGLAALAAGFVAGVLVARREA